MRAEDFSVFDALPLRIFVLDSGYRIQFWNRYLENATGWKFKDLQGTDARLRIPALSRPDYSLRIEDVFRSGMPAVLSPQLDKPLIEVEQKNGIRQVQSITITATPCTDGTGFLAVVAIQDVIDWTRSLELEAELERTAGALKIKHSELKVADQYAQLVVESVPNGILVVDRDGTITLANSSAERLFGYEKSELFGQPVEMLLPQMLRAPDPGQRTEFFFNPQAHATGSGLDLFGVRKDSSEFPVEIELNSIEADGETSLLCSVVDITERKRTERKILQVAQLKSEFLANMSHDIRTPMNVIIGMSGLLLDTELTQDQADYTQTIRKGAESLLGIINEVLDFSKLEAGRLEPHPEDFSIDSVAEDTAEFFSQQALQKGLELTCFMASDVPTWARGDRGRLRQILTNLIGNALKFTEQGEVSLHVSLVEQNAGKSVIRFEVCDTGIGIAPEVQERLFQAFTQADGSTTRKYGGSGLGLAISKRLAEMMGGNIYVESELGRGSRFCLQLPYDALQAPKPLESDSTHELTGMRVLVVDDMESNRTIVEQYLGSWEMKADSAENGLQAITKIREAARSGEPYDLVVLDCGMPGMSGIDVARLFTADHKIAATPLIMLTSYDDRHELKAAKNVDIRALLTKPVRKQMLRKAIIKAVAPKPSVPVAVGGQVERPKPPKTPILQPRGMLLLVEDNEDNQKLAVRLLAKHGFDCDIASNGLEAVTKFAEQSYSMVLMDCQMPVMDGFAATIAMRKEEQRRPRRTAIIAMTAHALREDREKCLSSGMDDYLSKPINEHHLVAAIRRWLPPVEAVLESAKSSEMIPVTGGTIDTKIQIRAKPGVSDLIPSYLSNRQHDLVSLAQAVNRGDLPAARFIGHGMKGSGAGYGFPAISEIGRSIEQCAISEDTAGIMRQISSLEEYLTRVEVVY